MGVEDLTVDDILADIRKHMIPHQGDDEISALELAEAEGISPNLAMKVLRDLETQGLYTSRQVRFRRGRIGLAFRKVKK